MRVANWSHANASLTVISTIATLKRYYEDVSLLKQINSLSLSGLPCLAITTAYYQQYCKLISSYFIITEP